MQRIGWAWIWPTVCTPSIPPLSTSVTVSLGEVSPAQQGSETAHAAGPARNIPTFILGLSSSPPKKCPVATPLLPSGRQVHGLALGSYRHLDCIESAKVYRDALRRVNCFDAETNQQSTRDLSPEQKIAIESLPGRKLLGSEE